METLNTDYLDYFPIKTGLKASNIGLKKLPHYENPEKNKIFQIDPASFARYRKNKEDCRAERLSKFYQNKTPHTAPLCRFLIDRLLQEYPQFFQFKKESDHSLLECRLSGETLAYDHTLELLPEKSNSLPDYADLLDALGMQLPEDLVLHSLDEKGDQAVMLHLCAANGWSAEGAIDRDFMYIHRDVPNFGKLVRNSRKICEAIIQSPTSMERIGGVNFRTSPRLNRHPEIPHEERHIPFDCDTNPHLFLRFERQTVTGFPEIGAFLFTIRTYLVECPKGPQENIELWNSFKEAFDCQDPAVNSYRFVDQNRGEVQKWFAKNG